MSTTDRLLSLLGLFTMERPEWSVDAAAAELNMTLSTMYRYFKSLADVGFIVADTAGRYTLGPAIIQYDRQMRLMDPLITAAAPVMQRLAQDIGRHAVVLLCRLYKTQVMCVHQESMGRPDFAFDYERGRPVPLHLGSPAKAILAHMSCRVVHPIYKRNAKEMQRVGLGGTWAEVKQTLRDLRARGPIVTHGELQRDLLGVSLPIFSPDGLVVGSLSVVRPFKAKGMHIDRTSVLLAEAIGQIDSALAAVAAHRTIVEATSRETPVLV